MGVLKGIQLGYWSKNTETRVDKDLGFRYVKMGESRSGFLLMRDLGWGV